MRRLAVGPVIVLLGALRQRASEATAAPSERLIAASKASSKIERPRATSLKSSPLRIISRPTSRRRRRALTSACEAVSSSRFLDLRSRDPVWWRLLASAPISLGLHASTSRLRREACGLSLFCRRPSLRRATAKRAAAVCRAAARSLRDASRLLASDAIALIIGFVACFNRSHARDGDDMRLGPSRLPRARGHRAAGHACRDVCRFGTLQTPAAR